MKLIVNANVLITNKEDILLLDEIIARYGNAVENVAVNVEAFKDSPVQQTQLPTQQPVQTVPVQTAPTQTVQQTVQQTVPVQPVQTAVPTQQPVQTVQTAPTQTVQQTVPVQPVQTAVPTQQPVQTVQTAPTQTVQQTVPVQPVQTAVPVAEKTYTLEDLQRASSTLVQAGKIQLLQGLLQEFNSLALTTLPVEQYGTFALRLRELGAAI